MVSVYFYNKKYLKKLTALVLTKKTFSPKKKQPESALNFFRKTQKLSLSQY